MSGHNKRSAEDMLSGMILTDPEGARKLREEMAQAEAAAQAIFDTIPVVDLYEGSGIFRSSQDSLHLAYDEIQTLKVRLENMTERAVAAEEELTRKRAPGGGRKPKPAGERMDRRTVRMDADRWEWCQAQGEASEYIRSLIDADREKRTPGRPAAKPAAPAAEGAGEKE